MGKYAVPEEIRAKRPDGTIVKKINGHFYVYETGKRKGADGRWRTVSGSCIGRIDEECGYVPNDRALRSQERGTLELGKPAVADDLSTETRAPRGKFLGADGADRIYDGFVPGLRRAIPERRFGGASIVRHVVGSGSRRSDLTGRGRESGKIGRSQADLLMALDVQSGGPVGSLLVEGRAIGSAVVRDLLRQVPLGGDMLFVDRGLDGDEGEVLLAQDGNDFVFPKDGNDARCDEAT